VKVLVCGGRDFADKEWLVAELDHLHHASKITLLVNGGAPGADTLASNWAITRGIAVSVYRADWEKYGRAAGPIRNQEMLDSEKPDAVLAFPGGRGTADMVARAKLFGVRLIREFCP
jgi:hypothetical protein